ncbi:MAG: hypothetical protein B6242_06335 [Anaerolineaceae bacterium 4572_78]|nr:MAG: hypothetical protein B6242_06335 [Anaerolineaceae bacterium 4572_78]
MIEFVKRLVLLTILFIAVWVALQAKTSAAEESTIDVTLARAAIKGYMISLIHNDPILDPNFYLDATVAESDEAKILKSQTITGYLINNQRWIDGTIYQVNITLSPSGDSMTAYVGKMLGRWRITGLVLDIPSMITPKATEAPVEMPSATMVSPTSAITPVTPLESEYVARVINYGLNVRTEISTGSEIIYWLEYATVVPVLEKDPSTGWLKVQTPDGQIGWMSSYVEYVQVFGSDEEIPPLPTATSIPMPTPTSYVAMSTPTSYVSVTVPAMPAVEPEAVSAPIPAAMPAGGSYLILEERSGGGIYFINQDGTGLRLLAYGMDPAISPDGQTIAFASWNPLPEVRTIRLDGTEGQAWEVGNKVRSPTWRADGTQIFYSYNEGGKPGIDGGSHADKYCKQFDENSPNFLYDLASFQLPDRAIEVEVLDKPYRICYKVPPYAYWFIRAINVATNENTPIPSGLYSYSPYAHPTNNSLLFFTNVPGIVIYNFDTQSHIPVTTDRQDRAPVVSPDGSSIAVSYYQHDHWSIHVMNFDGGNRQMLTETSLTDIALGKSNANNAAPAWSPDGSQIAFLSDRNGKWELWVMNADGSNQRSMFQPGVLDNINFQYDGMDERMIIWR